MTAPEGSEGTEPAEMSAERRRAFAVVAHPDDPGYGCSAAVAAWADAGKEVVYVLATRGEAGTDTLAPDACGPPRERERRESAAVLGVSEAGFPEHRDGMIAYGTGPRRDVAAAIRHRPEPMVTLGHRDTWGDGPGAPWNTPDHLAAGRAAGRFGGRPAVAFALFGR